jgi:aspartokinase/homoserine dehydrogenase 1
LAVNGDESWKDSYEEMVDRHHKMIDTIITDTSDREQLFNKVGRHVRAASFHLFRCLSYSRLECQDAGCHRELCERLSSNIVATLVRGSQWMDSRDFIKTESVNGKNTLDSELTNALVKQAFARLPPCHWFRFHLDR